MPEPGMLGKLQKVTDPRTLRFRTYVRKKGLAPPPSSRSWDKGIVAWGMMMNGPQPNMPPGVPREGIGCCTCAACAHGIQVTSANVGVMITVPDAPILELYQKVGGYVPGNQATDQGCVELYVLREWQQNGIGGRRALAYAECSVTDEADVKDCIELFGFCYIGFQVPSQAMWQFENGRAWDVAADDGGIVGGHAVIAVDFDVDGITVITWGQRQRMTWAFWHQYVDEAYGVVLPEWIAQNGQSPSGFALQDLLNDVGQLTQDPQPVPVPTPVPPAPAVDPVLVQWLDWAENVVTYVRNSYVAGDYADALTWQTQLAQYTPGILAMLQNEPHALPATMPPRPL